MENLNTISIKDVANRLGVSKEFVRNAIEQGTLPGAYTKSPDGRRTFVIPRKAFEEFETHWNLKPSDELIIQLIKVIGQGNNIKGGVKCQKED